MCLTLHPNFSKPELNNRNFCVVCFYRALPHMFAKITLNKYFITKISFIPQTVFFSLQNILPLDYSAVTLEEANVALNFFFFFFFTYSLSIKAYSNKLICSRLVLHNHSKDIFMSKIRTAPFKTMCFKTIKTINVLNSYQIPVTRALDWHAQTALYTDIINKLNA